MACFDVISFFCERLTTNLPTSNPFSMDSHRPDDLKSPVSHFKQGEIQFPHLWKVLCYFSVPAIAYRLDHE